MANETIKVALIGNPNVGKTSLFNQLTGLNQQVGNYPGITVDKKIGYCKLDGKTIEILDLPGTYSIHPASPDERIVINILLNKNHKNHPDVIIVIADITTLSRNLLLYTQVKDLGIPTLLALNMSDQMAKHGIDIDIIALGKLLKTQISLVSSIKNKGIDILKQHVLNYNDLDSAPCFNSSIIDPNYFKKIEQSFPEQSVYQSWLQLTQKESLNFLDNEQRMKLASFESDKLLLKQLQHKETIVRYKFIRECLKATYTKDSKKATGRRYLLDKILTHNFFGYLIFAILSLLVFESVFNWSAWPMEKIDQSFAWLSVWVSDHLPPGSFTRLIAEGIIPGLSGIIIFVPQIAILFFFMALFEESGYMSRVVFLMDNIMKRFGLSGKSIVPLISGTACAIPAIMATRNIENWKERLISILVIPFITCSARLPVYAILIALIIPNTKILGFLSLQGFTLLLLYALGFIMAILGAAILNKVLKTNSKNVFIIEMPDYRLPIAKNVFITVIEKSKSFIWGAGRIILAISIILWFLASNGPGISFKNVEQLAKEESKRQNLPEDEVTYYIAAYKLEHSYIGKMGNIIEPIIRPLGYDWKIGIALISSFAAREIFVGTLATIYSVGNSDDNVTVLEKLKKEVNPLTGEPRFTFAVGISLLLFYAIAMQCMSTLVIVRRETKSWKWPIYQLLIMSGMAYFVSLIAYQMLK